MKIENNKLTRFWAIFAGRYAAKMRFLPNNIAEELFIKGIIVDRLTVVSIRRLHNLNAICSRRTLPPGTFVECGVGLGGCIALMSFVSNGQRNVWGFDSFEGMPEQTAEDEGDGRNWVGYKCSGEKGILEAKDTLKNYHVDGPWVNLVKGYFEETLPKYESMISPIAVLRLDNDWYKSTKYCLDTLYRYVSINGAIIIDDYHCFAGCRKAVDEFRDKWRIDSPLITTEADSEAYWFKLK